MVTGGGADGIGYTMREGTGAAGGVVGKPVTTGVATGEAAGGGYGVPGYAVCGGVP